MRVILILLLLGIASTAKAQTIAVASGEHQGFSRLVLTFPAGAEWQLGRTEKGYALNISGGAPVYDLSDVYRRLSRSRLSNILADDGVLFLEVKCPCYAMPFELGPGQLVVDIRDGVAPGGSSFENLFRYQDDTLTTLEQAGAPTEHGGARDSGADGVLDWAGVVGVASRLSEPGVRLPVQDLETQIGQSRIRDALLWQFSKGAAQGVVEMIAGGEVGDQPFATGISDQVAIVDSAGPGLNTSDSRSQQMLADGSACIDDESLAIATWAKAGSVARSFGQVRSGLLGEFDQPIPGAISDAARYLLYLGFGAEVRQMLKAFDVKSPEREMWQSMALVLDLEADQSGIFSGMEVCNTAAALWAVLADPEIRIGEKIEIPAILRSFSALPLHLRRHLGPRLTDRFLARGDILSSRAIKDAILRSSAEPEASVRVLAAKVEYATGNIEESTKAFENISKMPGPAGIEATIELAGLQAQNGGEVSAKVTTALEGYYQEARGGDADLELRKILAMSYASQNRFDEAFSFLPRNIGSSEEIWIRLAEFGNDNALIGNAILPDGFTAPALPVSTDQRIAERLIDIGFADEALSWLNENRRNSRIPNETDRILRAKAASATGDDRAALRHLAGLATDSAELQRARALTALEDNRASESYAKIEAITEWQRSARRRRAWRELTKLGPDGSWGPALNLLDGYGAPLANPEGALPNADGPIARSRMAVDESATSRKVLETLLRETKIEFVTQ
tara:strand:+ start:6535 stop:8754 length:2220 start_codon:yes stop_codon:yes gene_type:complete